MLKHWEYWCCLFVVVVLYFFSVHSVWLCSVVTWLVVVVVLLLFLYCCHRNINDKPKRRRKKKEREKRRRTQECAMRHNEPITHNATGFAYRFCIYIYFLLFFLSIIKMIRLVYECFFPQLSSVCVCWLSSFFCIRSSWKKKRKKKKIRHQANYGLQTTKRQFRMTECFSEFTWASIAIYVFICFCSTACIRKR